MESRPRSWLWKGVRVARVVAAVILLVFLLLYLFQEKLIFMPTRALDFTPADVKLAYTDIDFRADDNTLLHGWYIEASEPRGVALFCHGNGGNISHRVYNAEFLVKKQKLSVFMFDYRGYGKSKGKPGEKGLYSDTLGAWKWLTEVKGISPQKIIIYGRSLGGAPAVWLANEVEAAGLVVESTFSSMVDMAAHIYPWIPARLILRHRFESIRRIPFIGEPLLVLHSRQDEVVPYDLGKRLYDAAERPKYMVDIPGGHNEATYLYSEEYASGWLKFLDTVLVEAEGE